MAIAQSTKRRRGQSRRRGSVAVTTWARVFQGTQRTSQLLCPGASVGRYPSPLQSTFIHSAAKVAQERQLADERAPVPVPSRFPVARPGFRSPVPVSAPCAAGGRSVRERRELLG